MTTSAWGQSWSTFWGDSWGAVASEVAAEFSDISAAFAQDASPIRLEPHEWRTLRRIRQIAKRDQRLALEALRLFKKRATRARKLARPPRQRERLAA